nr:type II toxin-antitoxin system PemK/MazF family toxin [Cryobacterium sp. TMS1-20-1]
MLVEQLTAVNQEIRLGEFAGRLNGSKMRATDAALQNLLGPD